MSTQFNPNNLKIKTAVLVFLKNLAAPLVLYFDDAEQMYNEIKEAIMAPSSKVFEFEPQGPIKKLCINASNIAGVAIQEEPHFS